MNFSDEYERVQARKEAEEEEFRRRAEQEGSYEVKKIVDLKILKVKRKFKFA